jgi:hypothetical protein
MLSGQWSMGASRNVSVFRPSLSSSPVPTTWMFQPATWSPYIMPRPSLARFEQKMVTGPTWSKNHAKEPEWSISMWLTTR